MLSRTTLPITSCHLPIVPWPHPSHHPLQVLMLEKGLTHEYANYLVSMRNLETEARHYS